MEGRGGGRQGFQENKEHIVEHEEGKEDVELSELPKVQWARGLCFGHDAMGVRVATKIKVLDKPLEEHHHRGHCAVQHTEFPAGRTHSPTVEIHAGAKTFR